MIDILSDIEMLDYIVLFNGKSIDINKYLSLHKQACDFADAFYEEYYDQNFSLFDNIKKLGVKDVIDMSDKLHMVYRARALYLDKNIYLYHKDIEELSSLTRKNKQDIENMMIAHELFHHLENISNRQLSDDEYREIAAHHFAYMVTNNHPEWLDYLWLDSKDKERLNRYVDYYLRQKGENHG